MKSLFFVAGVTGVIVATFACAKQPEQTTPVSSGVQPTVAITAQQPDVMAQANTTTTPPATAPAAAKPAATTAPAAAGAAPAASGDKPYKVVDGTKVDAFTMEGFRTWRAAACDRCHGANQEGMVGPSLITSLQVLNKDQFKQTVTEGRLPKGMPSFATNKQVIDHLDNLYAYLKGRSDGAITKSKVEQIQ